MEILFLSMKTVRERRISIYSSGFPTFMNVCFQLFVTLQHYVFTWLELTTYTRKIALSCY
jgi:hypothetical protein